MHCMKCGTKLADDQVFCDNCLSGMENYPVRPGTAVHLPQRPQPDAKKAAVKKKAPTAEETVAKLRALVRWLLFLVFVLAVCVGISAYLLIQHAQEAKPQETLGQNYSTIAPGT